MKTCLLNNILLVFYRPIYTIYLSMTTAMDDMTMQTFSNATVGTEGTETSTWAVDIHSTSTPGPVVWTWSAVSWEWWQILQLILAIVGIIGNFVVLLVIFRPGRKRSSTDTLIGALAVADFLTSIFIIPHRQARTVPSTLTAQVYCRIINSSVLMWISICASIFTLTTISIERLMAVRYPFKFQRIFSPKRTAIAIVLIWIFSIILNTFSFYVHFLKNSSCLVIFPSSQFQKFIGVSVFLVEYLIPIIVMVPAHILTVRTLQMRRKSLASGDKHDKKLLIAQRRVMEMLFIVVITFIICWTPDQFGFLVFNLGAVDFTHLYSPLYRAFVVLAFVNSCANPFIYAARNTNFRKAIKELFGRTPKRGYKSVFAEVGDSKTSDRTGVSEAPTMSVNQTKVWNIITNALVSGYQSSKC